MRFRLFEQSFTNLRSDNIKELLESIDSLWKSVLNVDLPIEDEVIFDASDKEDFCMLVDMWEHHVLENKDSIDSYLNISEELCKSIINNIARNIDSNNMDNREIVDKINDSIIFGNNKITLMRLILHHSRIRHLLMLAELYSIDANKEVLTWRHLFEMGCECLGIENERQYIDLCFTLNDPNSVYEEHIGSSLHFCFLRKFGNYFKGPAIDWETDTKIKHYMRMELYGGLMYADLAYRKHIKLPNPNVILHPYKIHYSQLGYKNLKGRFRLQGNMNGYLAYRGDRRPTIVIGFSGTEILSKDNWKTNFTQYFGHVTPEHMQAVGLIYGVRLGKNHKNQFKSAPIEVYGHSLGGGLMQYAVASNNDPSVRGFGYNSAGLNIDNAQTIKNKNCSRIWHLYRKFDYVFPLPGTIQLGKSVKSRGFDSTMVCSHFISSIRKSAGKYFIGVAELSNK